MALLVAVKSLKLASTAKNRVNPNLSSVDQFFEDDHGMLLEHGHKSNALTCFNTDDPDNQKTATTYD